MFGRLEVDCEFKLRWLLDGKIGRLGAFEDLVHVSGGAAVHVGKAGPVDMSPPESTYSLSPYMDGSRFLSAKLAI